MFPCPCCGRLVFDEPSGSEEICPVCFWQDDLFGLLDPYTVSGPNKVSLERGQKNFALAGSSDTRLPRRRQAPAAKYALDHNWRAVDAGDKFSADSYDLKRGSPYYWRADYWLRT